MMDEMDAGHVQVKAAPVSRGRLVLLVLASILVMCPFAFRPSANPWVFGLYSIPRFLLMMTLGLGVFTAGWFYLRLGVRSLYLLLTVFLIALAVAIPVELVGQVYAYMHPGYDVLFLKADPLFGWRIPPNMSFTWAGHEWYARNFSVKIQTNAMGFCDLPRTVEKPPGTVRIALLGDSMVEALQVPFEKNAGQLLEKRLNAKQEVALPGERVEVLNFGTSNYSVGQYLLVWENIAAQCKPDYVFVFVAH